MVRDRATKLAPKDRVFPDEPGDVGIHSIHNAFDLPEGKVFGGPVDAKRGRRPNAKKFTLVGQVKLPRLKESRLRQAYNLNKEFIDNHRGGMAVIAGKRLSNV